MEDVEKQLSPQQSEMLTKAGIDVSNLDSESILQWIELFTGLLKRFLRKS